MVLIRWIAALSLLWLVACAPAPELAKQDDIAALATEIAGLGPGVDPAEAARAAEIAYRYTQVLARQYQITDPPLIHNTKVNLGARPRGLCWHWAEDIEARLLAEGFQTLDMHRAIANADNPFRIDHSTALISAKGQTMDEGIVLDPWRYGGRLFWAPIAEDTRYGWEPRAEVLAKRREELMRATNGAAG